MLLIIPTVTLPAIDINIRKQIKRESQAQQSYMGYTAFKAGAVVSRQPAEYITTAFIQNVPDITDAMPATRALIASAGRYDGAFE